MSEKEIRIDEVGLLQKHMEDFGIGAADPNGPQRRYLKRRRAEIPTVADTGFSEPAVRLEEIDALEAHMNKAQIGNGNPEHPLREYVKARRAQLQEEEGPVEEPVLAGGASPEQPAEPWKRPEGWKKKNKRK
jgi:hypothetical protein